MASKARAEAYEHARAVILVLVGIIIGGFMYFVAEKVIYSNYGESAAFRFLPYSYSQSYRASEQPRTFWERVQFKKSFSGVRSIDPPTGD